MIKRITLTIEVMDSIEADKRVQTALHSTRGRETLVIDPIQIAVRTWLETQGLNPTGWIEVWADPEDA